MSTQRVKDIIQTNFTEDEYRELFINIFGHINQRQLGNFMLKTVTLVCDKCLTIQYKETDDINNIIDGYPITLCLNCLSKIDCNDCGDLIISDNILCDAHKDGDYNEISTLLGFDIGNIEELLEELELVF